MPRARWWLSVVILLLALSACGTGSDRDAPVATGDGETPAGTPAADPSVEETGSGIAFVVTTFDGNRFSAAEQRGTPVVLNFWESW